jgi:hypothetical protein
MQAAFSKTFPKTNRVLEKAPISIYIKNSILYAQGQEREKGKIERNAIFFTWTAPISL